MVAEVVGSAAPVGSVPRLRLRNCKHCRIIFQPTRFKQRYCTPSCKQRYYTEQAMQEWDDLTGRTHSGRREPHHAKDN